MNSNNMTNTNNHKDYSNIRFSCEAEDISHYTPVVYKLSAIEVINNGGITCISTYCRCINKINCDCLKKLRQSIIKTY